MDENAKQAKPKRSRLERFAPAIFWGGIILMPTTMMVGSYFLYKTAQMELATAIVNNTPIES